MLQIKAEIIASILKTAGLFTSQEAYDKYMKEHPDADPKKHKVVKAPTTKAKDRMQMINYKGLKDTHDELKKHLGDSVYRLPGDEKNLHFVNYKALQDAKDILKKKKLDFNVHKVYSSFGFKNANLLGLNIGNKVKNENGLIATIVDDFDTQWVIKGKNSIGKIFTKTIDKRTGKCERRNPMAKDHYWVKA